MTPTMTPTMTWTPTPTPTQTPTMTPTQTRTPIFTPTNELSSILTTINGAPSNINYLSMNPASLINNININTNYVPSYSAPTPSPVIYSGNPQTENGKAIVLDQALLPGTTQINLYGIESEYANILIPGSQFTTETGEILIIKSIEIIEVPTNNAQNGFSLLKEYFDNTTLIDVVIILQDSLKKKAKIIILPEVVNKKGVLTSNIPVSFITNAPIFNDDSNNLNNLNNSNNSIKSALIIQSNGQNLAPPPPLNKNFSMIAQERSNNNFFATPNTRNISQPGQLLVNVPYQLSSDSNNYGQIQSIPENKAQIVFPNAYSDADIYSYNGALQPKGSDYVPLNTISQTDKTLSRMDYQPPPLPPSFDFSHFGALRANNTDNVKPVNAIQGLDTYRDNILDDNLYNITGQPGYDKKTPLTNRVFYTMVNSNENNIPTYPPSNFY
jgi:hypothetical protein